MIYYMRIIYKYKLRKNLLKNKLFTKIKLKNMYDMLTNEDIIFFSNNYEYLMKIFIDMDKSITFEGDNYLLNENYFNEYFSFNYRTQLGMFVRGKYIYDNKNEFNNIMTQEAETISFSIMIGYVFYVNKSFDIFYNYKLVKKTNSNKMITKKLFD